MSTGTTKASKGWLAFWRARADENAARLRKGDVEGIVGRVVPFDR